MLTITKLDVKNDFSSLTNKINKRRIFFIFIEYKTEKEVRELIDSIHLQHTKANFIE
jgi:hypothetical protein